MQLVDGYTGSAGRGLLAVRGILVNDIRQHHRSPSTQPWGSQSERERRTSVPLEADSAVAAAARQEACSTPAEPDREEELGPIPNYPEGPRVGIYQELCLLWGEPMPETEEVGQLSSLGGVHTRVS